MPTNASAFELNTPEMASDYRNVATRNLLQLSSSQAGSLVQVTDESLSCRLMAMGVVPGSLIQVVRIAPFNGGIILKINGRNLAIRHSEAAAILVR